MQYSLLGEIARWRGAGSVRGCACPGAAARAVGASLQVGAPLGQYDPDRLVNLGTNRWSFRPEFGVSKRLGSVWLALNGNYYAGGRTTVDGVKQNDELGNPRLGATFAWPLDQRHSIKLHASDGVAVRAGDDFTTFGIAWQYRWGAGL